MLAVEKALAPIPSAIAVGVFVIVVSTIWWHDHVAPKLIERRRRKHMTKQSAPKVFDGTVVEGR